MQGPWNACQHNSVDGAVKAGCCAVPCLTMNMARGDLPVDSMADRRGVQHRLHGNAVGYPCTPWVEGIVYTVPIPRLTHWLALTYSRSEGSTS